MTKRSTWTGDTVVYRYGCPSWADLDEEGKRQLQLATGVRNELVRIERRYEAMSSALWLSIPPVAVAQASVDAATLAVEQAAEVLRKHRVHVRSTVADPDLKAALRDARAVRKTAKDALKSAKAEAKPLHQQQRAELDVAKRCASGGCTSSRLCEKHDRVNCQAHCHHRCPHPDDLRLYDIWTGQGLGYSSYTDIIDKHRVSVARVIALRKQGQPAKHRYSDSPDEGTLTVQIKYGSRVNRDHWALVGGRPAKEWLQRDRHSHEQITPSRRTFRLRIGRAPGYGPYWLELPVVEHRPVPDDAVVAWARVTRRLVADRLRLSVTLTALQPSVEPKTVGETVDVDFRWTSGGKGTGVRVARVSTASGGLPAPPSDVAGLVTAGDWYEIWAPAFWRDVLGHADAIRADRSELLDQLRPAVVETLTDSSLAEVVGFGPDAARLMKFAKYHQLADAWPAGHPVAAQVRAWRARDLHLWQYEANERDQVLARRRDAYRKLAAWLADAAQVIAVRDVDVAELRRRPDVDSEDGYEARHARRQIQFAAPAELKAAIVNAAARRGVQVIHYDTEEGQ